MYLPSQGHPLLHTTLYRLLLLLTGKQGSYFTSTGMRETVVDVVAGVERRDMVITPMVAKSVLSKSMMGVSVVAVRIWMSFTECMITSERKLNHWFKLRENVRQRTVQR